MKPPAEVEGVPWFPGCVAAFAATPEEARAGWGYVLVEEVAGAVAELMRWPWPLADQLGHLYWPAADENERVTASVPLATLRQGMYEPSGLERSPRAGDAFAAELGGTGWAVPDSVQEAVRDLGELFPGAVLDISADAREAAKLAYQGANAAIYDGSGADDLLLSAEERRERRGPATELVIVRPRTGLDGNREARR